MVGTLSYALYDEADTHNLDKEIQQLTRWHLNGL